MLGTLQSIRKLVSTLKIEAMSHLAATEQERLSICLQKEMDYSRYSYKVIRMLLKQKIYIIFQVYCETLKCILVTAVIFVHFLSKEEEKMVKGNLAIQL